MERVVVTGMSLITSLGLDLNTNWENLLAGRSGVAKIKQFDASECQTQIAAEIPENFEQQWPQYIKKRAAEQMTRITKACYVAAKDAVKMSGVDFEEADKTRCAVILGVVTTANTSSEKGTTPQNRILKSMNNAMSSWISLEYKLLGPNFTVSAACASSAFAIGLAYDMIKNGMADIVIAGGADSIVNKEEIEGFNHLYAISTENDNPEKASKPFSKNRDGFVIGEGAGVIILESEKSARKRNARILAEIAGYATTSEAYNIMAPMKDGEGIAHTLQLALQKSGINTEDVDYINAHGTSTTLNDKYETLAIKKVFGDRAYKIPISSSKSMIGHTIGAAGAIELIITIQSLINGIITPTINLNDPDPELDLDFVPNTARKHEINCALSNSFAFGGHNAVLVIKKFQ
ncbi:MAG: beta-ketoacyl-[acyl-carrier-protein] synthase family protein [Bacteroidales bacterium]|jgi:3-oxoacyl-[acyl-carrier-protein] synthase II|nr:beta-ketoacyl-[acyl-carrier-protein] synthase family protein [Bacteroidales bacterium]MDD4213478.1 beta-ketoacyl-[acyl-carrier-protein] synthase family protein [Bacteroidales bacterium]